MAYTVWNNGSILVFIAKLSAKKADSDLKKESQEWKERRIYLRMVEKGKLKVLKLVRRLCNKHRYLQYSMNSTFFLLLPQN